MKTSLFRTSAAAAVLFASSAAWAGDRHSACCCCPCTVATAAQPATQGPEATPPAAPADAVTQQSQSVEPVAPAPMVAPRTGVTYRTYSTTRQRADSGSYSPERRLHPSNRFWRF